MEISFAAKRRIIIGSFVVLMGLLYAFKNASFLIRILSAMSAIVLVYAIDHYFNARFTVYHYLFVYIMAVGAFLLSPLYYIYPSYDKLQHFLFPILYSAIIFHLASKLRLHRKWELLFTLALVIASLALFELGEFGLDYFFDFKLQGVYLRDLSGLGKYDILLDPNDDTMIDLLLGILGAISYWMVSLLGYFGKKRIAKKKAAHRNSKHHRVR